MFEKKKLWMVLASAALVAACGGGSGGGSPIGGGDGSGGNGGGDNTGGGSTPANDTTLQSSLVMHPEQIIVNRLLPLSAYMDMDSAGGGLFGQAKGTDNNGAPFQTFGLRIEDTAQALEGATVGEESATGRLALSLMERAATVGEGEQPENVQIMLTGVTLSTNAEGVVSASVAEGATMFVSGQTATGETITNVDVPIPQGAISVVPITSVPGGEGDATGDAGLIFNVDAAFANADAADAAELAKLAPLSGRFDMNFALSAADISRSGSLVEEQSIGVTGNDMEPVVGSGIPGNIWVEMVPPAQ